MKKYLFYLLPILVMCFSITSRAETYTAPNGQTYYVKYSLQNDFSYQNQHFKADYYTNQYIGIYNNLPYIWVNGARQQLVMSPYNAGTYTFNAQSINVGQAPENTKLLRYASAGNTYTTVDSCINVQTGTTGVTLQFNTGSYGFTSSTFPVFQTTTDLDAYIAQSAIQIDYDNMTYLSSIPTPNVFMVFDSLTASQNPQVPIIAKLAPTLWGSQSSLPLYLAVQYRVWSPTDVNVEIKNGFTYYRADAYQASETKDLYAFGDNFPVSPTAETKIYFQTADPDNGTLGDTLVENFTDLLSQIAGVGRRFYGALSGSPQFQAGADAYNLYAKNAVTMGNRVELWFTYYFVNDQHQPWCGLTTYWVSTNPEEFTTQQNAYDPLGTVSGWASSVTDTIRKVLQGGGGEGEPAPEYPSNNPTIGDPQFMPEQPASVPNNQNYPSIVSYNHDNIFTQFVGTYNSAKSFFGEFPQFFSDCLGWIPAEVWSVIAIGFGVAILVMILKIL